MEQNGTRKIGGIPGPNGRFVKGGFSYGGPGTRPGTRLIGDKPLTPSERTSRSSKKHPETRKLWRLKNPDKVRLEKRKKRLKSYGLTIETCDAMWISQGKRCAVCRSDNPFSKKGWQIDHCHKTGVARGILCTHCNRMLAGALDKPENLEAGIEFLRKHGRPHVHPGRVITGAARKCSGYA